jgi:hypothetical protein
MDKSKDRIFGIFYLCSIVAFGQKNYPLQQQERYEYQPNQRQYQQVENNQYERFDHQQYEPTYTYPSEPQRQIEERNYETDNRYYQEVDEPEYPPQPFAYEYGGADKDGRHFAKTESKDEDGVVKGEYRVELPDGRVQIVSYRADPVLGYQADVRYEGEATPAPEYNEDYQQRKPFVPNNNYKPYARQY